MKDNNIETAFRERHTAQLPPTRQPLGQDL